MLSKIKSDYQQKKIVTFRGLKCISVDFRKGNLEITPTEPDGTVHHARPIGKFDTVTFNSRNTILHYGENFHLTYREVNMNVEVFSSTVRFDEKVCIIEAD
jgi:hypothetical protein